MTDDSGSILPRWKCHKEVWGFKIAAITAEPTGTKAVLWSDGSMIAVHVSEEYFIKHKPVAGGYYVRYDDGYESFSPAKAFEEGYTLKQ